MKKGLSILLVAAALFGFYGGAVSLNDVLACKDYWEVAGEESTANMNKLEDGLNQLKENEQAYLDGQEQLAEGEKTLADGEAQYAQGLADYEAAPGKLADARKQLADGEKQLAEGKAKLADGYASYKAAPGNLADLEKLINGLENARTSFNDYSTDDKGNKGPSWKQGFEAKAKKADYSDAGLKQARQVITAQLNKEADSVALIESLSGESKLLDGVNNAKTYKDFDKALEKPIDAFGKAAEQLGTLKTMAESYAADTDDTKALKAGLKGETQVPTKYDEAGNATEAKKLNEMTLAETEDALAKLNAVIAAGEKKAAAGKAELDEGKAAIEAMKKMQAAGATTFEQAGDQGKGLAAKLGVPASYPIANVLSGTQSKVDAGQKEYDEGQKSLETAKQSSGLLTKLVEGRKTAQGTIAGVKAKAGDKLAMAGALDERLGSLVNAIEALSGESVDLPNGKYAETYEQLQGGLKVLAGVLEEKINQINSNKASFAAWRAGYKQLAGGQDQLASTKSGIPFAFTNMLNNKSIRPVINKKAPSLVPLLKAYSGKRLGNDDLDEFSKDMAVVADTIIPNALPILKGIRAQGLKDYAAAPKQLAQGEKDLAAGKAKLADGYKQYEAGLADYEAAPGKLADAEKQLADGRQALADGKAKLAEYEDGEQQVRDGLKTLTDTEADLDLKSIADRLNGDVDFDNGDNHLELDEGLAAVEVGRGYQAEDGVLITDEIMARAVGTGALLGAGALAVLAAILSFLKKNKGAGIFAILAAAAGAFGAFYGTQAGTYFSSIAGSTVGATGWTAAGILAAVALVHSIVHFTAKKDA